MLLLLTSTAPAATDLGYLLHKNPARALVFELPFGHAHVFYPEATDTRCTAALFVEVDPVALSRSASREQENAPLQPYVNDRPYVASSFLSVAIARVFGTAMGGRCKDRPDLVDTSLPLEAFLPAVHCSGGEALLRQLFEPLGYAVEATQIPLDPARPAWGPSRLFAVRLRKETPLAALLAHLYVLLPVLDDEKHYWVGDDEIHKLLRHGESWLAAHPACELITRRYLKHQKPLARRALQSLLAEEQPDAESDDVVHAMEEHAVERPIKLDVLRREAVLQALVESGAASVLDLGCGEGKLLRMLLEKSQFKIVTGVDVSHRSLEIAHRRLDLDRLPEARRARIKLLHGSLTYRDQRLAGHDAAAVVEVIEHLEPARLESFQRALFEHARPRTVILTTPNAEYNACFEQLPAGKFRHRDHRFEWTRAEFEAWCAETASRFGYAVRHTPIGPVHEIHGAPTQMAVFTS